MTITPLIPVDTLVSLMQVAMMVTIAVVATILVPRLGDFVRRVVFVVGGPRSAGQY